MDNTTYIALSRQQALWNHLEVVANNLANVNTTGFKGTDTLFAQYVYKLDAADRPFKEKVSFVHDFGLVRNLSQGEFTHTGNTFDMAIQGEGYFAVQNPTGPGEVYTRAGSFTVDVNGNLVNQKGLNVLSTTGAPINIPGDAGEIIVQGDGSVGEVNGRTFGRVRVVTFADERDLKQLDGTLFRAEGMAAIDSAQPHIAQGVLESSNVNAVSEMTRLISLNRAYSDVSRMVDTEHERKRKAMDVFTRQMTA